MHRFALTAVGVLLLSVTTGAAQPPERRCGWLDNPTPANWWLRDRDGEWVLSLQGGPPAPGMDAMPDMTTAGWVQTNGNYGYGCACLSVVTDPRTRRVLRVLAAQPLPISRCRADRALPPR